MSSIISDLFYGSKQNILDNYLINRHDNNQESSTHNKQETVLYASFIEFIIRVPHISDTHNNLHLKVQVEMGDRTDEGVLDIRSGKQENYQNPSIVLTFNDIQKQDLNKYTNVKVTISEGKYSKIHGFIPIQSIKTIANSFSNEKTITVHMKGKSELPFTSVQCTIRTQFPNNNILNSEIMRSMEKDHESYIKSKHQVSNQFNQNRFKSPSNIDESSHKITVKGRQPLNKRKSPKKIGRQTSNLIIEDKPKRKFQSSQNYSQADFTEIAKEIKSVKIIFQKIELAQSVKAQKEQILLRSGDMTYKIGEIIEFKELTRQGINMDVIIADKVIGSIHLSPLLLTLTNISGQLPIYSDLQQCLGTILVQSPNYHQIVSKQKPIVSKPIQKKQDKIESTHQLLLLSIDKIILMDSKNQLNSSQYQILKNQADYFNFTKMQALNKVEVILRVNSSIHKFVDIVFHYNIERQSLKIVELKRKDGFIIRHYQPSQSDEINIEIQIFSTYRLISYSKIILKKSDHFFHKFAPGDSQCATLHTGIYLKGIRLHPKTDYFQQQKIGTIFNILQDFLSNKIMLNQISVSQIKKVMNYHKNVTYVELKKLSILLQRNMEQFKNFQNSRFSSVYSLETPEINGAIISLSQKLLQQFLYIANPTLKKINFDQFQKIIEFYKENIQLSFGNLWRQFVNNSIRDKEGVLYIFFVSGLYFVEVSQNAQKKDLYSQQNKKKHEDSYQEAKNKRNNQREQNQNQGIAKDPKQLSIKVEPSYFISKINITNAHLLNQGKAPNICISLTSKINYSNSNPQFIVQKETSLLQTIKIYHKSIAENKFVLVAEFQPLRRQAYYELQPSGKCLAKITWGF